MVTAVDDENMDKKIQFILIDTGSESNQINMSDVRKMDNGIQISETHKHVNKIVDLLIRIHFSYIINTRVRLPGKHIWSKVCVLNDLIADNIAVIKHPNLPRLFCRKPSSARKRPCRSSASR